MRQNIKDELIARGWVDKGDVLVRYSVPRVGWKPKDGTLIIGYREWPTKVHSVAEIEQILLSHYF